METRTYIFADPTGGGDDAKLTLPAWAEPPSKIRAHHIEGDPAVFELDGPEDDDEWPPEGVRLGCNQWHEA